MKLTQYGAPNRSFYFMFLNIWLNINEMWFPFAKKKTVQFKIIKHFQKNVQFNFSLLQYIVTICVHIWKGIFVTRCQEVMAIVLSRVQGYIFFCQAYNYYLSFLYLLHYNKRELWGCYVSFVGKNNCYTTLSYFMASKCLYI